MTNHSESLVTSCKNALCITWDDEQTNQLLVEYIQSSKVYFSNFTERELTFDEDTAVREMVIERVRYLYNNAVDEFEKNFSSRIASFIQQEAVFSFLDSLDRCEDIGQDKNNTQ